MVFTEKYLLTFFVNFNCHVQKDLKIDTNAVCLKNSHVSSVRKHILQQPCATPKMHWPLI